MGSANTSTLHLLIYGNVQLCDVSCVVLFSRTPRTDSTQDNDESSVSSEEEMSLPSPVRGSSETRRGEDKVPYPLPMPAYGGYFAPLSEYLPDNLQPSSGFHR